MTDELDLARSSAAALARLTRPAGREYHGGGTTGDGDRCPLFPDHGRMIVNQATQTQYCPDQDHDGIWVKGDHQSPTPFTWPLGTQAMGEAVIAWKESRDVV